MMGFLQDTITELVHFISEGYSSYKENVLHTSCKSFFSENPIANLIGVLCCPILLVFLLRSLSKESIDNKGVIFESVVYGGAFGLLLGLAMIVPCLLGATVELSGDVAVGLLYGLFIWAWTAGETSGFRVSLMVFLAVFYSGLIFLKHFE